MILIFEKFLSLLFVLLVMTRGYSYANSERTSQNLHRYLLVVGANHGGETRPTLRYAVSDALSLSSLLGQLGGISSQNRIEVAEPSPDQLREALDLLEKKLQATPKHERREAIVYYSGHADERGLLLRGERFSWKELRKQVESLSADVRISILDACGSGAIVRSKGGHRRPAFLMDESSQLKGTAFLTSSTENEVSQESDRLRASFFTHALVSGLRGAADLDGDQKVSLGEAYQFAFQETLNRTEATTGGTQHPSRDMNLSGSGDVILTDLRGSGSTLIIPKQLDGRLTIRDQNTSLVAELQKKKDRPIEIGLAPGQYRILRENQKISEQTIWLSPGQRQEVLAMNFQPVHTESTRWRGGFSTTPSQQGWRLLTRPMEHSYQLDLFSNMENEPLNAMQLSFFANVAQQGINGEQIALVGGNFTPKGFDGVQVGMFNLSDDSSSYLQVSWTINYANRHRGAQIGHINVAKKSYGLQASIINVTKEYTQGLQAGFFNLSMGITQGIQAGLANLSIDSAHCVQGGVLNITTDHHNGVQGGLVNFTAKSLSGVQGGLVNVTGKQREGEQGTQGGLINLARSTSLQGGFVNVAGKSEIQAGFINIADECRLPIGLFNFVRKGLWGVYGALDERRWSRLSLFSGSPWFYSNLTISRANNHHDLMGFGFGLGTRFGSQGPVWVDLNWSNHFEQSMDNSIFDVDWASIETDSAVNEEMDKQAYNVHEKFSLDIGWNICSYVAISSGFSMNMSSTKNMGLIDPPLGHWQGQMDWEGRRVWYWTGFQAKVIIGHLGTGSW